jgi:hypothetical protein
MVLVAAGSPELSPYDQERPLRKLARALAFCAFAGIAACQTAPAAESSTAQENEEARRLASIRALFLKIDPTVRRMVASAILKDWKRGARTPVFQFARSYSGSTISGPNVSRSFVGDSIVYCVKARADVASMSSESTFVFNASIREGKKLSVTGRAETLTYMCKEP